MRKWVIIGVIAAGVAVFAIIVLTAAPPGEGSLEYHIRGYRDAAQRARGGNTLLGKVRDIWSVMRGETVNAGWDMHEHRQALVRLGYLEERTFIVSNRPPALVARVVRYSSAELNSEFAEAESEGTNKVRIVAMYGEMPKWDKLIREADWVPAVKSQ